MKPDLQSYRPAKGITLALGSLLLPHLALFPGAFLTANYLNSFSTLWLLYAPLWLMTLAVIVGAVLRHWFIYGFYDAVLWRIDHTWRPSRVGWRKSLRAVAGFGIGAALLFGYPLAGWDSLWSIPLFGVNYFVWAVIIAIALRIKGGRRTESERAQREADFTQQVADAFLSYYTREADYRETVKIPQVSLVSGKTTTETKVFVDNQSRYQFVYDRILEVVEVQPWVFDVSFRNDVDGKTDDAFLKYAEEASSKIGTHGWEEQKVDARAGYITIRFWLGQKHDATTEPSGMPLWAGGQEIKPTPKSLPIGIDDDGNLVSVGLAETNLIIGGQPRSGKSGTLASIYAQLAQLPNVATMNFDPKLVELGSWAERASFNSIGDCCFPYALRATYAEMERRYIILRHYGLKKITPDMWDEYPSLVLILDELAKVFSDPENLATPALKTENYLITRKLIAEGGAAGISVITATQRPSANLVPTDMRNLIQQAIAHSMKRESDTRMVLGDIDGTLAHELTASQKGVGYFINEGSRTPTLFRASFVMNNAERSAFLTNPNTPSSIRYIAENYPTIEEIVEATKHLRVSLPFLDDDPDLQRHFEAHRLNEENNLRELGLI